MGNDDGLVDQVQAAADRAGEPVWPLPLPDGVPQADSTPTSPTSRTSPAAGYGGALDRRAVPAGVRRRHAVGPPRHRRARRGADERRRLRAKGGTGFGVRTLLELLDRRLQQTELVTAVVTLLCGGSARRVGAGGQVARPTPTPRPRGPAPGWKRQRRSWRSVASRSSPSSSSDRARRRARRRRCSSRRRPELAPPASAVLGLQRLGQPGELAAVERRQLPAHGQHARRRRAGPARTGSTGRAPARTASAPPVAAEAEGPGGLGEREVEAGGLGLEAGGQPAQQPGGRSGRARRARTARRRRSGGRGRRGR